MSELLMMAGETKKNRAPVGGTSSVRPRNLTHTLPTQQEAKARKQAEKEREKVTPRNASCSVVKLK